MRIIHAAALYWVVGLVCGFALGAVRTLFLEPILGPFIATACELPVMLTALWFGAAWAIATARLGPARSPRAAMGALWLVLFFVTEILLGLWMRGWTLGQTFAHFATPAGALGLAGFVLAALLPLGAPQHFPVR